ncbi:MAG: hypothetical protein D6784_15885 [Chloroflexi bacterium]|nr:MAG: hypothetical protein D6784_15885 [Chloroflexota bacterium]
MTSGTTVWLNSVWGSRANDVFAVGDNGTILHYDGSSWSAMNSGFPDYDFFDIWGTSSRDVFVVGWGWNGGFYDSIVLHYDGSSWSKVLSYPMDEFLSIWGRSATDVFVGVDIGAILHYDGTAWQEMESGTGNFLSSLWGDSTHIFAVGNGGTILYYYTPAKVYLPLVVRGS